MQAANRAAGRSSDWAEHHWVQHHGPPIALPAASEWDAVQVAIPTVQGAPTQPRAVPRPVGQRVMYVLHLFSGRRRHEDFQHFFEQVYYGGSSGSPGGADEAGQQARVEGHVLGGRILVCTLDSRILVRITYTSMYRWELAEP